MKRSVLRFGSSRVERLLVAIALMTAGLNLSPVWAQSQEFVPEEAVDELAQTDLLTITNVSIRPTANSVMVSLIAGEPITNSTSEISGNALIITIPDAVLALEDPSVAEQFSPFDGIALIQVAESFDGGVEVVITGTDAPPVANIANARDPVTGTSNDLILSVTPGDPSTAVEIENDAIQVIVTATRTEEDIQDVPRSVTVIEREQLEQQEFLSNSVVDILGKLVPGLAPPSFNNSTSELELRGRSLSIFIDGVPQTPNANGNAADLRIIDPSAIERIEVIRGPSAVFGDGGAGGIVNIITRRPTEEKITFDADVRIGTSLSEISDDSFFYFGQLGVSGSSEKVDGRFSVSYDIKQGQYDADGDRIIPTNTVDTDRLNILAKLGYEPDENQRLEFTYNFYRDSLDTAFIPDESVQLEPGLQKGRSLEIGTFDFEEEPKQTNHLLNLTYSNADVFGSQLDAQIYYRDRDLVQRFTDLSTNPLFSTPPFDVLFAPFPLLWQTSLKSSEFGGRLQLDTDLSETADILWGVDYSNEKNNRPLLVSDLNTFRSDRRLEIIDDTLSQTGEYTVESIGLFAQGNWDISEQWFVTGGLRYENFDVSVEDYQLAFIDITQLPRDRQGGDVSFDDIAFNAGVLYRPIPEIGLFANFAQGFSIPDVSSPLSNVAATFSVEDELLLEPQKINNYEIGLRTDYDEVQASFSLFYNESDLGVNFAADANGNLIPIRAPQRNYGFEATVDWQPSDKWRLGGLFSWNEGENDADEDGEFVALGAFDIKPIKVSLYVENDTTEHWTNRLELLGVAGRDRAFDAGVDNTPTEGYVTLDYLSTIKLGKGDLRIGISNLLNNQYITASRQVLDNAFVEARRAAAPGITLTVGYSLDF